METTAILHLNQGKSAVSMTESVKRNLRENNRGDSKKKRKTIKAQILYSKRERRSWMRKRYKSV
jgi:hypothetical protein